MFARSSGETSQDCRATIGTEAPTAPTAMPLGPGDAGPMGMGLVGQLQRTGYAVTGTVTRVIDGNTARLDLSGDFSIGSAPGPPRSLNTTNNPKTGQRMRAKPWSRTPPSAPGATITRVAARAHNVTTPVSDLPHESSARV